MRERGVCLLPSAAIRFPGPGQKGKRGLLSIAWLMPDTRRVEAAGQIFIVIARPQCAPLKYIHYLLFASKVNHVRGRAEKKYIWYKRDTPLSIIERQQLDRKPNLTISRRPLGIITFSPFSRTKNIYAYIQTFGCARRRASYSTWQIPGEGLINIRRK